MRKLEWDGYPRLQMLFLVILTGVAGLLASYGLLRGGFDSMALRYPVAVACAYAVFLLLLWLWLRTRAEDYVDAPIDLPLPSGGPGRAAEQAEVFSGGGGQFGGGGASGRFDFSEPLPSPSMPGIELKGGSPGEAVGEALGGADEGAIPLAIALVLALVAAALLFAALHIVYMAPALFAELLVDGVLSASLYRRLRGLQTRHWLESAVRRTLLPFGTTALVLSAIGYGLQSYAPEADSLGEVLQHYRAPKQ
jgi:hypothetical protein